MVEREVGDWQRFSNRRQVGSYTGGCGGERQWEQHAPPPITKHGNVRLRTALVGGWWSGSAVKKWWPVLGNAKATRAAKKKAIVAMARQMAVELWRWRTGRVPPENLGWTMVGE